MSVNKIEYPVHSGMVRELVAVVPNLYVTVAILGKPEERTLFIYISSSIHTFILHIYPSSFAVASLHCPHSRMLGGETSSGSPAEN
jgi:hypothetical protein